MAKKRESTSCAAIAGDVPVGGLVASTEDVAYNVGRATVKLTVRNTGDRPIQVGSHFHFFEVNRYLSFQRDKAFGYHLNIPATTAIRFEPGEAREVELVAYGGRQRVVGFGGLVGGYTGGEPTPTYTPRKGKTVARAKAAGYKFDD